MSDGSVEGVVAEIGDTASYGKNGFRKRTVVLQQESGKFTNYIPVDFIQDGCDSVDDMVAGDSVEITFTLTGRKWQKDAASEVRYFLNAQASAWRSLTGAVPASAPEAPPAPATAPAGFGDDEIPF